VQIIGFILAILIGIVLGLIGGGGSILTIPLVEYVFGKSTYDATSYSLIVVSFSALFGVLQRLGKNQFAYKEALVFGIPSIIVAFIIRSTVIHFIPENFSVLDCELTRDGTLSVLLITVMIIVAIRMLHPHKNPENITLPSNVKIVTMGIFTGLLAGFLGAGGGFIIVPILIGMGLDMRRAVSTSMLITFFQSMIAILGDFLSKGKSGGFDIDWKLAISLSVLSMLGVFVGTLLQRHVSTKLLRKLFASILIVVAIGIFIQRIFF